MSEAPKPRVAIVDYQLANMFSVRLACAMVGLDPVITSDPAAIAGADAVVLPGVGAFAEAMANLHKLDLVEPLRDFIASGAPFLGICLGMQVLFSESDEFVVTKGLDVIPGRVVRFPFQTKQGSKIRVPQIGWNRITRPAGRTWDGTPLEGTPSGEYMYFLHSYYVVPEKSEDTLSVTDYEGIEYASGVSRGNVYGVQFHPEKSGPNGVRIYSSFSNLITAAATSRT